VSPGEAALLVGGGLLAGIVNTLAGGGSMLTVPLLVLVGLPGTVANGSNRIGVLLQSATAAWRFRAQGVPGVQEALRVLVPVGVGSVIGAWGIAQLADATFERVFGLAMLLLLLPTLRPPGSRTAPRPWSPTTTFLVFLVIGIYGGALQAGVGLVLVLTLVAVPVFVAEGQVAWLPAGVLALGFAAGGEVGARLAVRGGERLIRPVLVLAVLALAGRMLGLY
jgi:uncharacterized membrane protein YfcA